MKNYQELLKNTGFKKQLLVVEDNFINREMLSEMLRTHYEVLEAADGEEGMEKLRANRESISLILLDLVMPKMDGFQFLEILMNDQLLRSIPVIVTTSSEGEEIRALEIGASDFVKKPYNEQVLLKRVDALVRLRSSIVLLQRTANDSLTGVLSSVFLQQYVQEILRNNLGQEYDVICTNIESFRMINERRGRVVGDDLLRYISDKLSGYVGDDEAVGRLRTDRFALLMKHREIGEYHKMEEHIRSNLAEDIVYPVILKFGIYPNVLHSESADQVFDKATYALDTISHHYGVFVAIYDDSFRKKREIEQDIVDHMEGALRNREFEVYYQPKHLIATDSTGGAEALVRWNRPGMGLVPPGNFIPVFEKNGFITNLDRYVWESVCMFLRDGIDEGRKQIPVSVNISRADFDIKDLDDVIQNLTMKYNIPHELLHLEITESAYNDNPLQVESIIMNLHNAGFRIELDDFGKGYSTLSVLSSVPLDVIKLDLSIVQGLNNPKEHTILKSIIEMSKSLGMETVAEGCETLQQAEELKKLGCTLIQGYYYSKPVNEEKFIEYLEKKS